MNIVYYSSDLFSEMCGVAIQSLCENNKDADDINIYVVEDNISDENKKRLNNIVQHFSSKIFFIKKPEQKETGNRHDRTNRKTGGILPAF